MAMKVLGIDFERANNCNNSACAVGLSIIENGRVKTSFQRLMRPPSNDFNPLCFRKHGLHWKDVKNQPTFGELWDELEPIVTEADLLVAHNAPHDAAVLEACCLYHDIDPPELDFICTLNASKKTWLLNKYDLRRVCQYLQIPLQHHNAESDAIACSMVLMKAIDAGFDLSSRHELIEIKGLSSEVHKQLTLIIEDGKVDGDEIRGLSEWFLRNQDAAAVWPGSAMQSLVDKILADGVVSDDEATEFYELSLVFLGIEERKKKRATKQPGQMSVCFTGFSEHQKCDLQATAVAAGWHVASGITKTLDLLVCGPEPGPKKLQKATDQGVEIVDVSEWMLRLEICG